MLNKVFVLALAELIRNGQSQLVVQARELADCAMEVLDFGVDLIHFPGPPPGLEPVDGRRHNGILYLAQPGTSATGGAGNLRNGDLLSFGHLDAPFLA